MAKSSIVGELINFRGLVYELYELTEEEIAIVEAATRL